MAKNSVLGKRNAYVYLLIILLLGIILAGFIKPLMEGFKEGSESQTMSSKKCVDPSWTYDERRNNCVHDPLRDGSCPPNPTIKGITYNVLKNDSDGKCYYNLNNNLNK